jgi:hypothetical protein
VQVDDIGRLIDWSEFWKFIYEPCGHETMFPRDRSVGFANATYIIRAIRAYHATCWECAHPWPEPEPEPPAEPDRFWWLQDVHADRQPVPHRPRAAPVPVHRVAIEGVFPDLVRQRVAT